MVTTHKCLKEWNATIEALGQGKQTILIRNYKTYLKGFLLYPTVNYALNDDYLESFQQKNQQFVEKNALPEKNGNKVLIKYFTILENIKEKPISEIPSDKYFIWTKEHVKSYLNGKKAFIWVLRVYKLKEPYWAEPTPGAVRYANIRDEVSLENMLPSINEKEYSKILRDIKF